MSSVSVSSLPESTQSLLSRSVSKPKMFLVLTGSSDSCFSADFGVQTGDSTATVYHVDGISFSSLTSVDKLSREYFRGSRFIGAFPKRPSDATADSLTHYFFEYLKIPGVAIFPPFADLLHYDLNLFAGCE